MKQTAAQFALLLSAALLSSAGAQQASPSTFTLPASVYATAPLTTAPAAVPATTTTNAVVTVPGSQPMVMPLNIYTLPYGTVTIASGVYFIPNYENTGISIYIQSLAPLKIATLEEMVRYQAEWARLTQQVTQPAAQIPAQPTQQAAPVAASVPAQGASLPAATPTIPLTTAPQPAPMPVAQALPAPVSALPAMPVAAAPATATSFPAAAAFSATLPSGGAQAFAMPVPTASTQSLAAQTQAQPQAVAQPVSQPQVFAQAQQPSPAAAAWSAPITLVPNYLRLNFRAIGSTVSYSVSNLSDSSSLQIDPRSLRVYQAGQPVEAQLTVRDSSTGAASGTLAPRAMLVGSVKALTHSGDALTLTWTARDAQGKTYPISYAWLPQ